MGGFVGKLLGGGSSSSSSVQNDTTVNVSPNIYNTFAPVVDDSRLQGILEQITVGNSNTAKAIESTGDGFAALGLVQAKATIEAAEIAKDSADKHLQQQRVSALIGAAAIVAAAVLPKLMARA